MLGIKKKDNKLLQKLIHTNFMKGRFFKKSLIIILLGAYLPTVTVGIISYFIATKQIKSEVQRTHSLQLQQTYNSIDSQVLNIHALSAQAANNPTFTGELKTTNLSTQIERLSEIMGSLSVMESSSALLYKVTLFSETALGDAELSFDSGLRYLTGKDDAKAYRELLNQSSRYSWVDSSVFGVDKAVSSISLVQKLQNGGGDAYGLLILFLDTKAINQIIRQSSPDSEEAALILGSQGELISSGKVGTEGENSMEELLRVQINKKLNEKGFFSFKNKNENYLVTYETLSRNGWKFAVATPLSRMMAPVELTSRLVIISCITVLLLTVIISFMTSGAVYKPIQRLMGVLHEELPSIKTQEGLDEIQLIEERWKDMSRERGMLRTKLEQNRNSLKKGFLLQLVQGHLYFVKEEELQEQFRQYWWEPEGKMFSMLIVKINSFMDENGRFQKNDARLATFAAANIIEELLRERNIDSAVLDFHDLSLSALVAFPAEIGREGIKTCLQEFSEEVIKTLDRFLHFQVTIVIGQTTCGLHDIFTATEDARQALRLRDINKDTQIIDLESLILQKESQASYPYGIEKRIMDILLSGRKEEVLKEIQRFVKKLHTPSATELFVKQSLLQLLGSFLHLFFRTGLNPETLFPGKDFYSELAEKQGTDDILEWFEQRLVIPYIQELERLKERKENTWDEEACVKKIIEILEKEYNTPISLEVCADRVEMTVKTLSIKFKEYAGINFIDYLTKLRLEKAKELLANSTLSVNEIAETVGYEPKYFMRIFKKQEGVTAGKYREDRYKAIHN